MDQIDLSSLLSRIRKFDDQKAFKLLFERFYGWLLRIAMDLVKQKEIAEEIVGDVFMNLWSKRQEIERIDNLKAYLFVSTKHRCYNHFKKTSRLPEEISPDSANLVPSKEDPERSFLTNELQSQIDQAIASLPEKCREIFTLVRSEGLSHKKVSEILSISPITVRNQLVIATKKINEVLTPYLKEAGKKI